MHYGCSIVEKKPKGGTLNAQLFLTLYVLVDTHAHLRIKFLCFVYTLTPATRAVLGRTEYGRNIIADAFDYYY
jgi:hypothetical protein